MLSSGNSCFSFEIRDCCQENPTRNVAKTLQGWDQEWSRSWPIHSLIRERVAADEPLAQRHQRPESEAYDRAPIVMRSQFSGERRAQPVVLLHEPSARLVGPQGLVAESSQITHLPRPRRPLRRRPGKAAASGGGIAPRLRPG